MEFKNIQRRRPYKNRGKSLSEDQGMSTAIRGYKGQEKKFSLGLWLECSLLSLECKPVMSGQITHLGYFKLSFDVTATRITKKGNAKFSVKVCTQSFSCCRHFLCFQESPGEKDVMSWALRTPHLGDIKNEKLLFWHDR